MPYQDCIQWHGPQKIVFDSFLRFLTVLSHFAAHRKRQSTESSMNLFSMAFATLGTFCKALVSESLSDKWSSCERLDGLPAFKRTSAMKEDNDFDMCRKPSTMLSEIEALMLAMKLFFNTEVVFEELGWEAVSLFSRNTSVTCLEDLSFVNGWQAPRICSHHYTPLIAK